MHIRRRRERLQMKRHLQAIEEVDWNEVNAARTRKHNARKATGIKAGLRVQSFAYSVSCDSIRTRQCRRLRRL